MPIHQVTHINSSEETAEARAAQPVDPATWLAHWADAESRVAIRKYFVRNPKLLKQSADGYQRELEWGRNNLDTAGRALHAEMWKVGANALIADGKPYGALLGYLVGIWYLRHGRPTCPMIVAHAIASAKDKEAEYSMGGVREVPAWLHAATATSGGLVVHNVSQCEEGHAPAASEAVEIGDAEKSVPAPAPPEPEGAAALRVSLHLNVAAAALKLSEWAAAKAACELVLEADEENGKARFRLAKALEGDGDVPGALTTVMALLKREPQHREGRKLLETLKARQAEEKAKFKKLFAAEPSALEAEVIEAAKKEARKATFEEAYASHVEARSGENERTIDAEEEEERTARLHREEAKYQASKSAAAPKKVASYMDSLI